MEQAHQDRLRDKYDEATWEGECLRWPGKLDTSGYGRFYWEHNQAPAHRAVYELMVGSIPKGWEIDHLCKNTWCIAVGHLEAVTKKENMLRSDWMSGVNARKTHCIHGHEFTEANTIIRSERRKGGRQCRTCKNEAHKLRMRRLRSS